jgi:uncharacterized OB-fold protein
VTDRPFSDHEFEQFLGQDKLMGSRCAACGALFVPPRSICPRCYGAEMEWAEMKGTGTLTAFTCIAIGPSFMADEGYDRENPYCTGVVELEEKVRVVARIEGVDTRNPEGISIGTPVTARFLHRRGDRGDRTFLAFEPLSRCDRRG